MIRPTRIFTLGAVIIMIVLTAGVARQYSVHGRHKFSRALAAAVADGSLNVRLGDLPGPDWDRVYLFGPYTPEATIRSALGFEWNGSMIRRLEDSDAFHLVLLVRGESVVMAVLHPRSHGDFTPESLGRAIPRALAEFEIVRTGKSGRIVLRSTLLR